MVIKIWIENLNVNVRSKLEVAIIHSKFKITIFMTQSIVTISFSKNVTIREHFRGNSGLVVLFRPYLFFENLTKKRKT